MENKEIVERLAEWMVKEYERRTLEEPNRIAYSSPEYRITRSDVEDWLTKNGIQWNVLYARVLTSLAWAKIRARLNKILKANNETYRFRDDKQQRNMREYWEKEFELKGETKVKEVK